MDFLVGDSRANSDVSERDMRHTNAVTQSNDVVLKFETLASENIYFAFVKQIMWKKKKQFYYIILCNYIKNQYYTSLKSKHFSSYVNLH